jgi:hypothetical protein
MGHKDLRHRRHTLLLHPEWWRWYACTGEGCQGFQEGREHHFGRSNLPDSDLRVLRHRREYLAPEIGCSTLGCCFASALEEVHLVPLRDEFVHHNSKLVPSDRVRYGSGTFISSFRVVSLLTWWRTVTCCRTNGLSTCTTSFP